MAKQANPALIGGFVVGAVVLVVAGILIFGSGLFVKTETYVLYFKGSLTGLTAGAPVNMRGVRIGSVTGIWVEFDSQNLEFRTPVLIQIEPNKVKDIGGPVERVDEELDQLIEKGLRAQLDWQSLVTGQLYVQLDFFPDTPVRLVGGDDEYRELPTITSALDKIAKTVTKIPIDQLVGQVENILQGVNRLVNDPELTAITHTLHETLRDIQKLVQNLSNQAEPLLVSFRDTSEAARLTLKEARKRLSMREGEAIYTLNETLIDIHKLAQNVDGQVKPLLGNLDNTLDAAQSALKRAQQALAGVDSMVSERSPLRHDFSRMLTDLSTAARSIRVLADYLERHPEALLQGKGRARRR